MVEALAELGQEARYFFVAQGKIQRLAGAIAWRALPWVARGWIQPLGDFILLSPAQR